ncbi:MAG TPA: CHAT domain-containing protein [Solirubrobacteraceae bacterium]|nr:CHAT domain-containing protein [Solirubrobacteraceae bacterium]
MDLIGSLIERCWRSSGASADFTAVDAWREPLDGKRWRCWAYFEGARQEGKRESWFQWLAAVPDHPDDGEPFSTKFEALLWYAEYAPAFGRYFLTQGDAQQATYLLSVGFNAWLELWEATTTFAPDELDELVRAVDRMMSVLFDIAGLGHDGRPDAVPTWANSRMRVQLFEVGVDLLRASADAEDEDGLHSAAGQLLGVLPALATEHEELLAKGAAVHLELGSAAENDSEAIAILDQGIELVRSGDSTGRTLIELDARLVVARAARVARTGRLEQALNEARHAVDTLHAIAAGGDAELSARCTLLDLESQLEPDDLLPRLRDLVTALEERARDMTTIDTLMPVKRDLDSAYRLLLAAIAKLVPPSSEQIDELFWIIRSLRSELVPRDGAEGDLLDTKAWSFRLLDRRLSRLPSTALFILEPVAGGVLLVVLESGSGTPEERCTVALGGAELERASGELIGASRGASDALISRLAAPEDLDSEPFEQAAADFSDALPVDVRARLEVAHTVLFAATAFRGSDEIPIEAIPLEDGRLGLTRVVARVATLDLLRNALAPNQFNVEPTDEMFVLRAEDPPDMDALLSAGAEMKGVLRVAQILELAPRLLEAPHSMEVKRALESGARVLHYIGHGVAGRADEQLFLRVDETLRASDLERMQGGRPPFTFLSTCLVGRSRHAPGGLHRGFGIALLQAGACGLIAATYSVPDDVCARVALAFYGLARSSPVGEALMCAKRELASHNMHPASWNAFALWGDPWATITPQQPVDGFASFTRDWPAYLSRWVATQRESDRDSCFGELAKLQSACPGTAVAVERLLSAIFTGTNDEEAVASLISDLAEFDMEGAMAVRLALAESRVRRLATEDASSKRQDALGEELGYALDLASDLDDSYAYVRFTRHAAEHLADGTPKVRVALNVATRMLPWLAADAAGVADSAEYVRAREQQWNEAYVIDLSALLGISEETQYDAYFGDDRALREVAMVLLPRETRPVVRIMQVSWRHWWLRYLATGTWSALADAVGALTDRNEATLSREISTALLQVLEDSAVGAVTDVQTWEGLLAGAQTLPHGDRLAIVAFRVFGRHANSIPVIAPDQAEDALSIIRDLDDPGLHAYLLMLVATASSAEATARYNLQALRLLGMLATDDAEYRPLIDTVAANLRACAVTLADDALQAWIDTSLGDLGTPSGTQQRTNPGVGPSTVVAQLEAEVERVMRNAVALALPDLAGGTPAEISGDEDPSRAEVAPTQSVPPTQPYGDGVTEATGPGPSGPRDDAAAAVDLGTRLEGERRYDAAEAAYRRADERGSAVGALKLGLLLEKAGFLDDADRAFFRAKERAGANGTKDWEVMIDARRALRRINGSNTEGHD